MDKKNIKVLVIEDNPGDARLIRELLLEEKDINFDVTQADRLNTGLEYLMNDEFDIILTDLGLPESQGFETFPKIYSQAPELPIIVLTGLNDENVAVKAVQEGAQDYLVKGQVDSNLLVRAMRYAIERKRMDEEMKKYSEHLEEEVKQRTNELIQSEKLASLGQLVAGVAHEVNNPLAFINSNTEIMEEQIQSLIDNTNDDQTRQLLQTLQNLIQTNINGIDRIATITRSLKRYATPDKGEINPADINRGIKDTLLILHNQLKHHVTVHETYGHLPEINCNIYQLNQVFLNLILNAAQAMDEGDIWLKTWTDNNNIYIEIRDNGSGIPNDKINKIFDPFFTSKDNGTGLGLSLSYRIINDHNGSIKVDSKEDEGTTMLIRLPVEV